MRTPVIPILLVLAAPLSAAPWVTITEIHYNPYEGDGLEFIEIHHREPPTADISGWTIDGEVRYTFPEGTRIAPGEYLVVARAPRLLQEVYPGAGNVLGPFSGKLDNAGGSIELRNRAGALVCEARYDREREWTPVPDGSGHTLSLRDPLFDPREPSSWAASREVGGTPGRPNDDSERGAATPLVERGASWRYFKGLQAPPWNWREVAFDDSGWPAGPSGFGYADEDDATVIDDMEGQYLSLFTRHAFEVTDIDSLERIVLRVDYDDGFICTLNGKELARALMGESGTEAPFDRPADDKHEAGVAAEYDLGDAAGVLRAGRNVLAVEVHNQELDSSDLTIIVELESRPHPVARSASAADIAVNEVHVPSPGAAARAGGEGAGFVELYNRSPDPFDLSGSWLGDLRLGHFGYRIPEGTVLPARGRVTVPLEALGEGFASELPARVAVTARGGRRVLDLLLLEEGRREDEGAKGGRKGDGGDSDGGDSDGGDSDGGDGDGAGNAPARRTHWGRLPDGGPAGVLSEPSPDAPNRSPPFPRIVINEIQYHPISEDGDDEFLELYNASAEDVLLAGCSLRGGIRYDFGASDRIGPEGYLVVAKDPKRISGQYGLAQTSVVGPFRGSLSNAGEEIRLRDPRGNVVDRVAYADRDPWPPAADGQGSTLELVHPDLDNALASSWRASDERGKARWKSFSYVGEHRDFKGRNLPELQVLLLGAGECLIDDVRVRGRGELLDDGSFESDAGAWRALGTHERSRVETEEGAHGSRSFRLIADGRGDPRHNYVTHSAPLALTPGQRYRIGLRARWQSGSPFLLTRTPGQGLAQMHELDVPSKLGSPGTTNGRRENTPPPAVGVPEQLPVAPTSADTVRVRAAVSATGSPIAVTLSYRRDGERSWQRVAMRPEREEPAAPDAIARVYVADVPPQPAGIVEFFVRAETAGGASGTYPLDAPQRTALYGVGLLTNDRFPTYTLLVARDTWQELLERPRLSNHLSDATLVYGDRRIFYNVGFRRRGSPFTRSRYNWRIVFGAQRLDGRKTLTVDGQGGDGTRLNERLTYWLLDQLHAPGVRQQYVYFKLWGYEEGIYEDVEKVDGEFLDRWFGPGADSAQDDEDTALARRRRETGPLERLHKVDDYFELFPDGGRDYTEAFLDFTSTDVELYRWNFPLRANGGIQDYRPLVELAHFMDPDTTPDAAFARDVESHVDGEEWARVLAARACASDWDTFGRERGKNSLLFRAPNDGRWRLLPWDCDLSWSRSDEALFSEKFPSVARLLSVPRYRRVFLGSLAYLAERSLEPGSFDRVLAELSTMTRAETEDFRSFASNRRAKILAEVPRVPLRIADSRRVRGRDEPDRLEVTGFAPLTAMRFRLDGREGTVELVGGDGGWRAEFPIGEDGGRAMLEAVDPGGGVLGAAEVRYASRSGAQPLPASGDDDVPAVLARRLELPPADPAEAPPESIADGATRARAATDTRAEGDLPAPYDAQTGRPSDAPPTAAHAGATAGDTERDAGSSRSVAAAPRRETTGDEVFARTLSPRADAARTPGAPEASDVSERAESADGASRRTTALSVPHRAPGGARAPLDGPAQGNTRGDEPPATRSRWPIVVAIFALLGALQAGFLVVARRKRSQPAAAGADDAPAAAAARATAELPARPDAAALPQRRRRERRASAPPVAVSGTPTATGAAHRCEDLTSTDFHHAVTALEAISLQPGPRTAELLAALGSEARTPFQKIRRRGDGLTATPCPGGRGLPLRAIAPLLLERALGKPAVQHPTKADWIAHWRRTRRVR